MHLMLFSNVINVEILDIDKIEGKSLILAQNTDKTYYRAVTENQTWLHPDAQKRLKHSFMSYVHTVVEKVCYINYVYSIYSLFTFDAWEGANGILIEFILDKQGYVLNECVFTKNDFFIPQLSLLMS